MLIVYSDDIKSYIRGLHAGKAREATEGWFHLERLQECICQSATTHFGFQHSNTAVDVYLDLYACH